MCVQATNFKIQNGEKGNKIKSSSNRGPLSLLRSTPCDPYQLCPSVADHLAVLIFTNHYLKGLTHLLSILIVYMENWKSISPETLEKSEGEKGLKLTSKNKHLYGTPEWNN